MDTVVKTTNRLTTNIERDTKRMYYFDNLKIALTCLVIAHHASQGYFSIDTGWPIQQGKFAIYIQS